MISNSKTIFPSLRPLTLENCPLTIGIYFRLRVLSHPIFVPVSSCSHTRDLFLYLRPLTLGCFFVYTRPFTLEIRAYIYIYVLSHGGLTSVSMSSHTRGLFLSPRPLTLNTCFCFFVLLHLIFVPSSSFSHTGFCPVAQS